MKIALIVIGVLVLLLLIFGGSLMGTRNELVQDREAINGAWAQVDTDLQRRADLIPNLVETVRGFAKHEKEVLENIANARSGLLNARSPQERIQANTQLDSALGRLLVVVENYPQLKANENFLALQAELSNTEDRLQTARRFYNGNVRDYNRRVQSFPSMIMARFGHFELEEFFEVDEALRGDAGVPKVDFSSLSNPTPAAPAAGSEEPAPPAPPGGSGQAPPPPPS